MKITIIDILILLMVSILITPVANAGDNRKKDGFQTITEESLHDYSESRAIGLERNTGGERAKQAFNLVNSAYRGQYGQQGIPGYNQLIVEYNSGDVRAINLIEAAIKEGDLASEAINDKNYINAVELHLKNLVRS